jgi:hypothetical protein
MSNAASAKAGDSESLRSGRAYDSDDSLFRRDSRHWFLRLTTSTHHRVATPIVRSLRFEPLGTYRDTVEIWWLCHQ